MTGTRTGFGRHQGGSGGYSFQFRYGESKWQYCNVYLPFGWGGTAPSTSTLPAMPAVFPMPGGTWYNPDAIDITPGSFTEEIALSASNNYYAVVITSEYRPGGYGIAVAEDIERVYWPEILRDCARVIQFIRTMGDLGGDRPVTDDPDLTLIPGVSSGGHKSLLSQLLPDGTFPYSARGVSHDRFAVTKSHVANAVIAITAQTTFSGFSKGGPGYSWFDSYADYSWAGALFGGGNDTTWDDIPMSIKRQADVGEHATADNPRCKEIGVYFTASHVSAVVPRANITNDPTGADPMSFVNRYWRYTGEDPAPIETIRPVVDNVQSVADAGAGLSKFVRASGSWSSDGYEAGDIVCASGFGGTNSHTTQSTNHRYIVESRTVTDLVVFDTTGEVDDLAAAEGQTISGGGLYDLHDEAHCYIGYDELTNAGSTRCRLRAGAVANTNPDATTANTLADLEDVEDWLETDFGWVSF